MSCLDDPDCFQLSNNVIGIYFGVLGSTAGDSVSINELSLNGQVLYSNADTAIVTTGLKVIADRVLERSKLELFGRNQAKFLDLEYSVKVQFVSEDCGPRYIYSNLTPVEHSFDSVLVIDGSPGRDEINVTRNIVVLRCPQLDSIGVSLFQLSLPATGPSVARPVTPILNAVTIDGGTQTWIGRTATFVKLPVNKSALSTEYTFDFADDFGGGESVRTLNIGYDLNTLTRYRPCGEQVFIGNLRAETVSAGVPFDSVGIPVGPNRVLQNAVTDPETTNFNLYRCPPTNRVQIAFENSLGRVVSKEISSVTSDYSADILYQDVTTSRIELALNPSANTTTFNIQIGETTHTIALSYSWSEPRATLYTPNSTCFERKVIANLSVAETNPSISIENPAVLFPAITNVILEVAD